MTEPIRLIVFRCDALHAKLSVAQCANNFAVATGIKPPGKGEAKRAGFGPCVGCELGREHHETGKLRSGLHTTVLSPHLSSETAKPTPTEIPRVEGLLVSSREVVDERRSVPATSGPRREPKEEPVAKLSSQRKWSIEVRKACVARVGRGESFSQIARDTGVDRATIRSWAKADGIEMPTASRSQSCFSDEQRASVLARWAAGESVDELAAELGCSSSLLYIWRKDSGVTREAMRTGTVVRASEAASSTPSPSAASERSADEELLEDLAVEASEAMRALVDGEHEFVLSQAQLAISRARHADARERRALMGIAKIGLDFTRGLVARAGG